MSKASDKIHRGSQASICFSTFSIIDTRVLRPPELPEHIQSPITATDLQLLLSSLKLGVSGGPTCEIVHLGF